MISSDDENSVVYTQSAAVSESQSSHVARKYQIPDAPGANRNSPPTPPTTLATRFAFDGVKLADWDAWRWNATMSGVDAGGVTGIFRVFFSGTIVPMLGAAGAASIAPEPFVTAPTE
jgi:hypothetical protein